MARYVARRLLQIIPLLVGISLLLFILLTLAPGDPVDLLILSNPQVRVEEVARLKRVYGLDQPVLVRYVKWLGRVARGDLGWSIGYKMPVADLLRDRLPRTLLLMGVGMTISVAVAIPLGVYSAVRQYSLADYVTSIGAFVGFSLPVFWFGLIAIYVFAIKWKLLPAGGFQGVQELSGWPGLVDRAGYLVLPAVVIALHNMASLTRYTRSAMLEVIAQDYVRVARAKGLAESRVLLHHAFRNALIPVVTVLGLMMPLLVGGAPVTETVFAWPGVGQLLVQAVVAGDHLVAMGALMAIAVLVVVSNLFADVAYSLIDPRVRYG